MPKSSKTEEKWTWKEVEPGRWLTTRKPEADICYPRVQRTFSKIKSTGDHGFHPYRNGEVLCGALPTLEAAQRRAQSGEKDAKIDAVTVYVDQHPCDVPPFLALTSEERAAVRAQYPHAAPSHEQERRGAAKAAGRDRGSRSEYPYAADESDPSTRRFLEARAGAQGGGAMLAPSGRPSTRRGRSAAESDPSQRLALVGSPEAPGREGSKRAARYRLVFDAAARGDTVAVLLAAGGNPVTLGKCVSRGLVELIAGGKNEEGSADKRDDGHAPKREANDKPERKGDPGAASAGRSKRAKRRKN